MSEIGGILFLWKNGKNVGSADTGNSEVIRRSLLKNKPDTTIKE
jgi:hypothetical protein